ncbi:MAG TPA: hypothetical protein VHG08_08685, partial [Longimicrobium sp.]|nr:hypothetical protein [Longimicrobium sp.]
MAATYARPAACGDASIRLMRLKSPSSRGVTSVHVPPPSRVTCTRPSSEPVQIVPTSRGDGAMVKMVPYVSTPVWSSVIGPPEGPRVAGSERVRLGEMRSQLLPSLVLRHRCCEPTYSTPASCGEMTMGKV